MTPDELGEIRARRAAVPESDLKVTPYQDPEDPSEWIPLISTGALPDYENYRIALVYEAWQDEMPYADFIANAPADIDALLARVDELRAENAAMRPVVEAAEHWAEERAEMLVSAELARRGDRLWAAVRAYREAQE